VPVTEPEVEPVVEPEVELAFEEQAVFNQW